MAFCPVCKSEIEEDEQKCSVCGSTIEENKSVEWRTLGYIEDEMSAEYARESLKSNEIPAVILSRSGFFGKVGLPLNPFPKPGTAAFEVVVPEEYFDEAAEVLDATISESWQKEENN